MPLEGDEAAVETLIGEGLFEYGDVDGRYPEARLQHPLGLAFAQGVVYVADTNNHQLRAEVLKDPLCLHVSTRWGRLCGRDFLLRRSAVPRVYHTPALPTKVAFSNVGTSQ